MDLTVCTANTLHGTAPRQNERYDFTALLGLDIVGFQETDRDAWFAAMRSAYVGRFRAPKGALRENTVAWSPLWTLKSSGYRMTHRGLAKVSPHRGFTWVVLEREGVTVGVLNTHLVSGVRGKGKFPVGWRRRRWARHMVALRVQVAKLLTACDHVVVLGDFNEVGPKVDIPGLKRLTPDDSIDHIFVSPGLHSLGVVNLARRGSDHAPRVATLTTRPVIPEPPKPDPEVDPVTDYVWLTDLADLCRKAGLEVVEIDGWKTRGRPRSKGPFTPAGVLWHHTGGPGGGKAYADWLAKTGRSDLPAPLCHLSVGRDGVVYVCAAGRANHAGKAKPSGTMAGGDGNAMYVGVECQNTGTEGWSKPQYAAMVTLGAALARRLGSSVEAQRGHKETSVTGKWDPGDLSMSKFRGDIKAELDRARPVPPKPQPDPAPVTRGPEVDIALVALSKAKARAGTKRAKALAAARAAVEAIPPVP